MELARSLDCAPKDPAVLAASISAMVLQIRALPIAPQLQLFWVLVEQAPARLANAKTAKA